MIAATAGRRRSAHAVLTLLTLTSLLIGGLGVPPAHATHTANEIDDFELDGNRADDSGPGDPLDWDSLADKTIIDDPFGNQPDNVFQGSKENEPKNWTFIENGSAPSKADIVQAGVGMRTINDEHWLYLFFERFADNGDTFLNFEFNRLQQTFDNDGDPTTPEIPFRSPGDLMISYTVTNGGMMTDIDILEWSGNELEGQWIEPTVMPAPVQGVDWDATTNATDKGRFTFAEAALHLEAFDQAPACPGFSQVWVKTTSSQQFETAALQDRTVTAQVDLNNCAQKDWLFAVNPQPIAGIDVWAVYTVPGATESDPPEDRELKLTDVDGDGLFTGSDGQVPAGTVTFHFELRAGDQVIWRSDHDDVAPGKQDGSETFEVDEVKTNFGDITYDITLTPSDAENHVDTDHVLTARVFDAATDEPLALIPVGFANLGSCGALSSAAATTDAGGEATTTLTSSEPCSTSVRAFVQGSQTGATADFDAGEANDVATKRFAEFAVSVTPDGDVNEADAPHTFTVTVTRDVGDGPAPVEGATVALALDPNEADAVITSINGTALEPPATSAECTTDAAGECEVVIEASEPGEVTLTATTAQANDSGSLEFSGSADKDFVDFALQIEGGGAVNEVGSDHPFTVVLTQDTGDGPVAFPDQTVTLTLDPGDSDAEFVSINGVPASGTEGECTTDANGECSVVVSASTAGSLVLTAEWETLLDSGEVTRTDTATKDFVDFALQIEGGGAVNEVGSDHPFTVVLTQDTGDGPVAFPDQTVTLTLDPGDSDAEFVSINGVPASGTEGECTTDANGECSVVVSASTAGSLVLTAEWETLLDSGEVTRTDTATKDFVDFDLQIEGGGVTNEVGESHEFTVVLTTDTGQGPEPFAGETVTLSLDQGETDAEFVEINGEPASGTSAECTTDADGECSVVINSSTPGTVTLSAHWETELDSGTASRDASADKVFGDFRLRIDNGGTVNEVGTDHTFTVTLERNVGDDFEPLAGEMIGLELTTNTAGAEITQIVVGVIDPGATSGTCQTDANGQCTVTITAADPGEVVLTATWNGVISGGEVTRTATADKAFVDFRLRIENGDKINDVGEPHLFMVVLERDTGDSNGFVGLSGETVSLSLDPNGTDAEITKINGGPAMGTVGTCMTNGGGTCSVEISSSEPGTVTLTASWETELDSGTATRTASADKAFVDFLLTVTPEEETNEVGTSHTFTALLERDTGDGFEPFAGETITWALDPGTTDATFTETSDGPASGTTASCVTGEDGTCTATIVGPSSGTATATATWQTELDSGTAMRSDTGIKHFNDFVLEVTPETAINEPGDPHTFTITLALDEGTGFTGLAGEMIELSLDPGETDAAFTEINGVPATGTTATCVTDENGQCEATIASTLPGEVVLTATWNGTVGSAGSATRTDTATKFFLATSLAKVSICPIDSGLTVPGGFVEYVLTYGGEGTTLGNATLTDTLPAEFQFESAEPAPDTAPEPGTTGVVQWDFGDLPDGTSATVSISGTIDPATPIGTEVVNTATFSVDGVGDKTAEHVLTVDHSASQDSSAYGISAELFGTELIPPTPLSDDDNPGQVLGVEIPSDDGGVATVRVLQVAENGVIDGDHAASSATAHATQVRVLDQGDDWLVTADAVTAMSASNATLATGSSSAAGSTLANVTIAGQNIGDVTEPTTVVVTDPLLGTRAEVRLLEMIPSGASAGDLQPDGDLFGSGLIVNAIHARVTDASGGVIADVVVGHAESSASFRGGLPCEPRPGVHAAGFALGAYADEAIVDDQNTLAGQEAASVLIPSTGGSDSATLAHVGPLTDGETTLAESNAAFSAANGSADDATNTAQAHAESEIEDLRLVGADDDWLIEADAVRATVDVAVDGTESATAEGTTTLVGLKIAGTDVCESIGLGSACTPAPNTVIDLSPIAMVVLNEQVTEPSGDGLAAFAVNAIRVVLLDPESSGAEILVSHARAAAFAAGFTVDTEPLTPAVTEIVRPVPLPEPMTAAEPPVAADPISPEPLEETEQVAVPEVPEMLDLNTAKDERIAIDRLWLELLARAALQDPVAEEAITVDADTTEVADEGSVLLGYLVRIGASLLLR